MLHSFNRVLIHVTHMTAALLLSISAIMFMSSCAVTSSNGTARTEESKHSLQQSANAAKSAFLEVDPGMKKLFDESAGYAIFPSIGKGGIGIGGAYGKGLVYENGVVVGYTNVTQVSIGFQLGGQTFREVIFFNKKSALSELEKGKFKFSANASAVAVTAGVSSAADYNNGVTVFSMAKGGLMYEASIGGQKFSFEPK